MTTAVAGLCLGSGSTFGLPQSRDVHMLIYHAGIAWRYRLKRSLVLLSAFDTYLGRMKD